jgi:Family of unknown function (DUF6088)
MAQYQAGQILARIYGNGRGKTFTPKDFLDLASHETVRKVLSRLTEEGTIRRLMRGVYDYPAFSTLLNALESSQPGCDCTRNIPRLVNPNLRDAVCGHSLVPVLTGQMQPWTTRIPPNGCCRVLYRVPCAHSFGSMTPSSFATSNFPFFAWPMYIFNRT